ncbi:MAG: hypothetical protein KQA41_02660 [Candidatus Aenigmarchaeota archaeon]|nr:hypothetical protein [Candidatus Aenigmarchaeota archaeon]
MKRKILETMLETIEDIQIKYDKILKDMERIISMSQASYTLSTDNKEKLDMLFQDLEKNQRLLFEINEKITRQDNEIVMIKEKGENEEKLKKALSTLLYDFQNLKQNYQKQFGILENKIVLLESKINMNKNSSLNKNTLTSLNEIKDTISIAMKNMNAKIGEIYKRIELLNDKQKIYEIMLKLSTSNAKIKISQYLDEFYTISKKIKDDNNLDEDLKMQIKEYLENMSSFWSNSGFEDIAQMFKQKKLEIEIM